MRTEKNAEPRPADEATARTTHCPVPQDDIDTSRLNLDRECCRAARRDPRPWATRSAIPVLTGEVAGPYVTVLHDVCGQRHRHYIGGDTGPLVLRRPHCSHGGHYLIEVVA